jgi:hypothetical protein
MHAHLNTLVMRRKSIDPVAILFELLLSAYHFNIDIFSVNVRCRSLAPPASYGLWQCCRAEKGSKMAWRAGQVFPVVVVQNDKVNCNKGGLYLSLRALVS